MNKATVMAYLGGLVRLVISFVGGYLAEKGLATKDEVDGLVTSIVLVATGMWSIWAKYKALQTPPPNASGIKPLGSTTLLGLLLLFGMLLGTGCVAIRADSTGEGAGVWAFGWGADSSAKLANVAVTGPGANAQTGVSFDAANSDQQTTQAFQSLVSLGAALAPMLAHQPAATKTSDAAVDVGMPSAGEAAAETAPATAATIEARATALSDAMIAAKASGKPLVVIAGNVGCSYCAKLDKLLDADAAFTGRSDFILVRETAAWASNQAGQWTGGGNFPVVRVTQWDANGAVLCDKKLNRPASVAEIEAALGQCAAPDAVSAIAESVNGKQ